MPGRRASVALRSRYGLRARGGAAPLLGETIGENLRRTVRASATARRGRSPPGVRATYHELGRGRPSPAALLARGVSPATGSDLGAEPLRVGHRPVRDRVGAILVNINPAYRTSELEYALHQSGISLLSAARAFRQTDYVAMLAEVRPNCPDLRRVVVLEDDWDSAAATPARMQIALAEREATLQFDDPINIQYTSQRRASPRAPLSHHNILNNGYFVGARCRYTERDRVCIPVPFYHCFGMVLGNLACTRTAPAWSIPRGVRSAGGPRAVEAERCTSLYGVPTMFIAELEHRDSASSTCRACEPASWPARRARSRRCGAWSPRCT